MADRLHEGMVVRLDEHFFPATIRAHGFLWVIEYPIMRHRYYCRSLVTGYGDDFHERFLEGYDGQT